MKFSYYKTTIIDLMIARQVFRNVKKHVRNREADFRPLYISAQKHHVLQYPRSSASSNLNRLFVDIYSILMIGLNTKQQDLIPNVWILWNYALLRCGHNQNTTILDTNKTTDMTGMMRVGRHVPVELLVSKQPYDGKGISV